MGSTFSFQLWIDLSKVFERSNRVKKNHKKRFADFFVGLIYWFNNASTGTRSRQAGLPLETRKKVGGLIEEAKLPQSAQSQVDF
jgi:hypothetical protein